MWRLIGALLGLLLGYVAGALLGVIFVSAFSSNTPYKNVDIAMAAVFATGPLGAVVGGIIGALRHPRRAQAT